MWKTKAAAPHRAAAFWLCETIWNALRRENPFRLAASRQATFPKGTAELPQSKPDGFASSLWEGAFGMAGKSPVLPRAPSQRGLSP